MLLVEPDYQSRYPPLGLLKLASYHRRMGDSAELVSGRSPVSCVPERIYVTSLFTYAWRPVHDAVAHYKSMFPDVPVTLGGIYASLLPQHAELSGAHRIQIGPIREAEEVMPAYDLVPEWKASIVFMSRGCIRRCGFCAVPTLEGSLSSPRTRIAASVYPSHDRVILWDNNILAVKNCVSLLDELIELGLEVDINQGLDARCVTKEVADKISKLQMPIVRLAYDYRGIGPFVKHAIRLLSDQSIEKNRMVVYVLFNYVDDPQDFFLRVRDLLEWGVTVYPMRYEPLTSLERNQYVSPKWDTSRLQKVANFRRLVNYAGGIPSTCELTRKFSESKGFDDAFEVTDGSFGEHMVPAMGLMEQGLDHQHVL